MAYAADKKPGELTALTVLATDDVFVVGDTSDASEVAKGITKANLITDLTTSFATAGHNHAGVYEPADATILKDADIGVTVAAALGANDNYVTDAEKAALATNVVGPVSATDNAIVRYDGTTGKLVQDSTVTVGDTGGIATTIAGAGNAAGLTVTQNDTTNNPRGVSITNAGTAASLFIDANGNTGSSASTSGALFLNNTDNVGIGANFYSNAGAGQGVSLVFMKQDNALADKPVLRIDNDGTLNAITINNNLATSATPAVGVANAGLSNNLSLTKSNTSNTSPVIDITNNAASSVGIQITHTDAANSQGLIKLISPSPEIEFFESDQTTPAGKFEIRGQNNQFTVNSRNSGDSGFENIITINQLQNGGLTKFFASIETAGTIELGHATDTTLSRVSAGVAAIEGNNIVTANMAASAANINTGTSTTVFNTPDALAGSYAGTKSLSVQVTDGTTDVATGDGKAYITIPEALNGMNLVRAQATVVTAGTTNATTVMIHNKTDAQDMLSGAISIASAGTVGTVGTINATYDDVATNDVLRIDVDSVSTTAPKGLQVILEFRLP